MVILIMMLIKILKSEVDLEYKNEQMKRKLVSL